MKRRKIILTRRQIGKSLIAVLASLGMIALPPGAAHAFRRFAGGTVGSSPSTITTFTLVNSGGSTAGVPTQTFGMPFVDGDMPAGSAPVFKIGGVSQPYSYGLRSYWPSGNLKFVSIMLAPTANLPTGNSMVSVAAQVGSWPAASGRTVADIYNQQLVVNAPALSLAGQSTGIGGNRSTQVSAWLNGDTNTYKVVQWMDGQAGAAWRISTNMSATQGGTADAFLKFDHYVFALGAGGSPLGFRWFGRMRMPSYSVTTAANNNFFCPAPNVESPTSGLNWQINPGGGGLITNPGFPWPFTAATDVTAIAATPQLSSTQANAWYTGAGSNGNLMPVQLSGAVPAPFAVGDCWWVLVNGAGDFEINGCSNLDDGTRQTPTASGTFTATPVIGFSPFTSISFANADGKYNFFQGTGSQSAETPLRMQINQTYWQSSRLIPTNDRSLSGSAFGGVIADTTYPFNWHPYCIATIGQSINAGGDSDFIGALKNQDVLDIYNQSVLSEKQIRICGLAGALMIYDFKDPTLDTVVNVSSNTYTGLPASNLTIAWGGGGTGGGFTLPGPPSFGTAPLGTDGADPSHMPHYPYWPYIRTGELQYFDNLSEIAIAAELNIIEGGRNPRAANGDAPYDANGCITYNIQQARGTGWSLRNLVCAALVAPWNSTTPTVADFDGTQRSKYLNDLANISIAFPIDLWNANPSGIFSAYAQSAYLYTQYQYNYYSGGAAYNSQPFWEMAYIGLGMCYGAALGNPKAIDILNLLASRAAYIGNTYGFYPLYGYTQQIVATTPPGNTGWGPTLITEDAQWVISNQEAIGSAAGSSNFVSWAPNSGGSTNAFTLHAAPGNGLIITDGFVIIPNNEEGPTFYPPELNLEGPFFVVDYNGSPGGGNYASWNLSNTLGGSAIPIASSGGGDSDPGFIFNYCPAVNLPLDVPYAANFLYQIQECAKWATALGSTGWATTFADCDYRNTYSDFGASPNYYYHIGGDPYNTIDARYCVQDTFA